MTRILQAAFISFLTVGVTASLTGCKVDCDKNDGSVQCLGQSTVQYTGTPITQQVAWSTGQGLTVAVTGGDVRVGSTATTSITINPYSLGGAPAECSDTSKVCVRFIPINNDTKDRRDEATRQMKQVSDGGNLNVSAGFENGAAVAKVALDSQNGKFNNSLSAVVDVWVPEAFDGDIAARTDSGGISVRGARRGADISTGLGDIAFDLSNIIANNVENKIYSKHGDITFTVPQTANINIQGLTKSASDSVIIDTASGWQQMDGSTAQSATFCGNSACDGHADGLWKVTADFGSIKITLN